MRHLIDFGDLSRQEWDEIYQRADKIINNPEQYLDVCHGKVSANLFYEPSTRTNFSFQTAMMRLGGSVFGFADPNSSSVAKGETLKGHRHAYPLGGRCQGRLSLRRCAGDQRR